MSKKIKEAGYTAVKRFEKRQGRTKFTVHEKDGYDLHTSGKGTRHIEVKATANERFHWRYLTEKEFKTVLCDPKFYLYLVTSALTNPKVTVMRRNDVLARYCGTQTLHVIRFPKKLQAAPSEVPEEI